MQAQWSTVVNYNFKQKLSRKKWKIKPRSLQTQKQAVKSWNPVALASLAIFDFEYASVSCLTKIDHFTVVCLVTWPVNESEAGIDLALIETSLLFLC